MMRHRVPLLARRLLPLAGLSLTLPLLVGFDYGTQILVSTEAEIYELEHNGEIEEEMRNQLLELLWNPLDINEADRESLQKLPDVTYEMADEIIASRDAQLFERAGQLRELLGRPVYAQCRSFFYVEEDAAKPLPVKGSVAARMTEQFNDETFPVLYLKGRIKAMKWLEAGVIVAEQEDIYGVEYGAGDVLIEGKRPKVSLERVHAAVYRDRFSIIAGHYKAGFGQRLVFDITDRDQAHGFYSDLKIYEDYENYDSYSVSKRLLGLAGRVNLLLPKGKVLEFTLFGSINPQDLYYADISPNDYTTTGAEEVSYPRFPNVYREELIGLNSTFRFSSRSHIGITGWIGHAVKQYDFDFTGYPIPNRPLYGAFGADMAFQIGLMDMLAEVALTDTGGFAGRGEWIFNPRKSEISVAFRYYGTEFDNPHSRGRSEPDELGKIDDEAELIPGGKRDVDELGPQVKAVFQPLPWLRLRAKGDLWYRMSLDMANLYVEGRVDVDPLPWLGIDVLGSLRDKDLSAGGREQSYDSYGDDEPAGAKLFIGTGMRVMPIEPLTFQVFYRASWEDASSVDEGFETSQYVWGKMMWDITDFMYLALRAKIYQGQSDTYGDHYGTAYAQLRFRLPGKVSIYGRYELINDLDQPEVITDELDGKLDPIHKLKVAIDWRF
jgi:hypothetical protein